MRLRALESLDMMPTRLATLAMLFAGADAFAAPQPDRVAATFDFAGSSALQRLSVSADGSLVAGVNNTGRVVLVDLETWEQAETDAACEAESVALQRRSDRTPGITNDGYFVYIGCDDGTIVSWRWFNGNLAEWIPEDTSDDDDGGSFFDTGPDTGGLFGGGGTSTSSVETFNVGSNPVAGLFVVDNTLWAMLEPSGGDINLRAVDLEAGELADGRIEFIESRLTSFQEAVLSNNGVAQQLYISHGNDQYSFFTLANGAVPTSNVQAVQNIWDPVDITPAPSGIYVADPDQGVGIWNGGPTLGAQFALSVNNANAMVNTFDETWEYLVLQRSTGVEIYTGTAAGIGAELASFAVDFEANDMIEAAPGYVFAGSTDGDLELITGRPFLSNLTMSPTSGTVGTEVAVSFETDSAGSWQLRIGGDRDDPNSGEELASGDADAAGTVETTITVDADFDEGDNDIWVDFFDSQTDRGWIRGAFTIDEPPDGVTLDEDALATGDEELILTFSGAVDPDLDRYDVYVSTTFFDSSTHPSGGPSTVVAGGLTSPVEQAATGTSGDVTVSLSPLVNGVTYYVAVRVIDEAGNQSELSNTISATPEPVVDCPICPDCDVCPTGCYQIEGCDTGRPTRVAWGFILLVGLFARRRSTPASGGSAC